jgi:hypothetical protein
MWHEKAKNDLKIKNVKKNGKSKFRKLIYCYIIQIMYLKSYASQSALFY